MSLSTRLRTWFSPEAAKRAQAAEHHGDLESACAAYTQAGRYGDAVRVMLVRAQAELEPHRRALLLAQATAIAPRGDPARAQAWKVRAQFILDRAEAGGLDPAIRRRELLDAARSLREHGENELAARALRIAGDLEGEIAALAEAGAVGPLEEAVARQRRAEEARARRAMRFEEARDLVAIGRRRDAHELLKSALSEGEAEDLRALMQGLLARRPSLPATVVVDGRTMELVTGNPVVLGRSDCDLRVPAPVVSRRHLEFSRRDGADPWVKDLGGKNGTTLRGARVESLPVGIGLDLLIGNALPLKVRPTDRGGLILELPGRVCWLPLGPIQLGPRRASIEATPDGWLELRLPRGQSVVLGDLRVDGAVQLLVGDELFETHGGPLLMRVLPTPPERP
ncbi:MAG: FHA domain-containing protein [Deltaproteobacteria bacterium]|nr:FHA domain-containing protein [Deltaproteobacteria bacterium]